MAVAAHDLILVGGGPASSLIAWCLALDRPELKVCEVPRDVRLGGPTIMDARVAQVDACHSVCLLPFDEPTLPGEPLVRRFYAGPGTTLDKARILTGKTPVPIQRALRQPGETGRGRPA